MCPLLYMFDGKYFMVNGRSVMKKYITVFRGMLNYTWNHKTVIVY
jgi:hypothetical protein